MKNLPRPFFRHLSSHFCRLHWYGGVKVLLPGQVMWKQLRVALKNSPLLGNDLCLHYQAVGYGHSVLLSA